MRLANYVYKKDFLTKEECNKLIKEGEKDLKKAVILKDEKEILANEPTRRNANVSFFNNRSHVQSIIQKIIDEICYLGSTLYGVYITDIEPIQYAEYEKGMFHMWHTDSPTKPNQTLTRDISVSLILNSKDEYTGGSLQMINSSCISTDNVITPKDVEVQEQGTLVVFPSSMIHQVTPVLSGVRKSVVLWTCSNMRPAKEWN